MSRVMAQGDFRPMAENREAMADLVAILEARSADYAQAEAELDTSGDTIEQSADEIVAAGAGSGRDDGLPIRASRSWPASAWNTA